MAICFIGKLLGARRALCRDGAACSVVGSSSAAAQAEGLSGQEEGLEGWVPDEPGDVSGAVGVFGSE